MFRRGLFVCAALALMAAAWPGSALAGPPPPARLPGQAGEWVVLDDSTRVTFYGPRYAGGEITASGIRYAPDADIVALGPGLLAQVRAHYAAQAEALGRPLWWAWSRSQVRDGSPGPQLRFGGIAGGFPRHACFVCEPDWWGYLVRVCDLGGGSCALLRLADTGSPALEVDLPDRTWERFGYPTTQGVFTGTLEVLTWR
jgi:hypothetical protein